MNTINNKIQDKVLTRIKQKAQFKYEGSLIDKVDIIKIEPIKPFNINENGKISFRGICEFKKHDDIGGFQIVSSYFTAFAEIDLENISIKLNDTSITLEKR